MVAITSFGGEMEGAQTKKLHCVLPPRAPGSPSEGHLMSLGGTSSVTVSFSSIVGIFRGQLREGRRDFPVNMGFLALRRLPLQGTTYMYVLSVPIYIHTNQSVHSRCRMLSVKGRRSFP